VSARTTARLLQASEYQVWEALLRASPQGSAYASPRYLETLAQHSGARFDLLGVWRGSDLVAGVPLFVRRYWGGVYVAPRLLLYYNGIVTASAASKYPSERTSRDIEIASALCDWFAASPFHSVVLKNAPGVIDVRVFQQRGWIAEPSYTYVVPLGDMANQWTIVEQNLRRLIKRCTDAAFAITADDDFDSFYQLHEATAERKGASLYLPAAAFKEYYAALKSAGLARLYHARTPDGTIAASQLVLLGPYAGAQTVSAATHPEHLRSGATAFLRWRVMELLASEGYRTNDLTDAALNPVTHFKAQFGGRLELCILLRSPARVLFRTHSAARDLRYSVARRLGRA
jgi:Acetyltransferase (GNAT) domain